MKTYLILEKTYFWKIIEIEKFKVLILCVAVAQN